MCVVEKNDTFEILRVWNVIDWSSTSKSWTQNSLDLVPGRKRLNVFFEDNLVTYDYKLSESSSVPLPGQVGQLSDVSVAHGERFKL